MTEVILFCQQNNDYRVFSTIVECTKNKSHLFENKKYFTKMGKQKIYGTLDYHVMYCLNVELFFVDHQFVLWICIYLCIYFSLEHI